MTDATTTIAASPTPASWRRELEAVEIEGDPHAPHEREHDEQHDRHAPIEDVALGLANDARQRDEADDA